METTNGVIKAKTKCSGRTRQHCALPSAAIGGSRKRRTAGEKSWHFPHPHPLPTPHPLGQRELSISGSVPHTKGTSCQTLPPLLPRKQNSYVPLRAKRRRPVDCAGFLSIGAQNEPLPRPWPHFNCTREHRAHLHSCRCLVLSRGSMG